jgi:periplasmic divalent cation tolerance protein
MTDAVIIFCTCGTHDEALTIANSLIEARLAACVNVLPPVQSIYRWQGKIETAQEVLLIIKTTQERFSAVRDRITQLHTYDTPEIVAIPVVDGLDSILFGSAAKCNPYLRSSLTALLSRSMPNIVAVSEAVS